ncbi:MAG: hypothetical protein WCI97_13175 [Bacteroidota bacterium]
MKKILLFLLFPLFSFSQDRGCQWSIGFSFSYSVNDSEIQHQVYSYSAPFPVTGFYDTSAISIFQNDSLTFYYGYGEGGAEFGPAGPNWTDTVPNPIIVEGLVLDSSFYNAGGSFCIHRTLKNIFTITKDASKVALTLSGGYPTVTFNINRIEDNRDRNVNVKLNSSSSLNIATKKGNQTLRMFSMNGQLIYSYSFDTAEFAGVNISLPENIFPSGIYILSLVSATEAQNIKVFVP